MLASPLRLSETPPASAARRRCSASTPTRSSTASVQSRDGSGGAGHRASGGPAGRTGAARRAGEPRRRNALTWAMYDQLSALCDTVADDERVGWS